MLKRVINNKFKTIKITRLPYILNNNNNNNKIVEEIKEVNRKLDYIYINTIVLNLVTLITFVK